MRVDFRRISGKRCERGKGIEHESLCCAGQLARNMRLPGGFYALRRIQPFPYFCIYCKFILIRRLLFCTEWFRDVGRLPKAFDAWVRCRQVYVVEIRQGNLLHIFMLSCFIGFEVIRAAIAQINAIPDISLFASNEQSLWAIGLNILLIQGLHIFDYLTWNRPGWSISTEFSTYLLFALLLWLRKHDWLAIAIVLIAAPIFIAFASDHNMNTTFDYGFIRCLFGFTVGIVALRIYSLYARKSRSPVV
jgi:hypothetical protein